MVAVEVVRSDCILNRQLTLNNVSLNCSGSLIYEFLKINTV